MQKRVILDSQLLEITINRLCQQLIENHGDFTNSVLIGLQPRGVFLAEIIQSKLETLLSKEIPLGKLDITFHRDDFGRRDEPFTPSKTEIPFLVEGKAVVLIDDVLFTGRSIRAALDAMTTFGRPEKVELLTLIDRKYTRDLPIEANYIGLQVNSMISQKVIVEWAGQEKVKENKVWLINN
jgi:pyrimidine operon attenuation protein/uracil phosphoribosyltransferase